MTISLNTYASGDSDYISKLNADNAAIKTAIDSFEATAGSGGVSLSSAVTKGLQFIFDRAGIIGEGSYKPTSGVLSGPNYYLPVAAGGYWDGSALAYQDSALSISMSSKSTGTYYITVDSSGAPTVNSSAGTRTLWQLHYDASTHTVSNVALHAGVAVLFSGADYADSLTSATMDLTFSSLAARLEEIESRLVAMGAYYQYDPDTTTGLDFSYREGQVRNDNAVWGTSADVVALTDDATNYVEVDPADGTVSANAIGFTTARMPLHEVVTAAGAITTVTDRRTWAAAGGGGEGGGGHTQNTDTGTNSNAFKLNMDVVGTPSENCKFEVKRGTSPSVSLRWSESAKKWQFTNDGVNYKDVMDTTALLAAQEWTQYVGVADPAKVLDSQARSSSIDYETVSLSSSITAPNGVQAVVLRVFFWDSSLGAGVYVALREHGGPAPQTAFSVWSDQYGSALLIIPVGSTLAFDYFVQASGMNTANVTAYLVGYFEKVSGVGTLDRETVQEGIGVAAGSSTSTDIAGACNRGLAYYLKVEETGGLISGGYDIELYADAAQTILLYQAVGITPSVAYEDYLPFWIRDADLASELHVKLKNNEQGNAATFTVTLKYEQFA